MFTFEFRILRFLYVLCEGGMINSSSGFFIKLSLFVWLFFFPLSSYTEAQTLPKQPRLIRILSIDGGGIRGVIPATILQHIESRLLPGLRIADCFDIIAGTSTGGIIALMLTTPNKNKKAKFTAAEICELYTNFGKNVFSVSFWHFLTSGNGWWGAKYSADTLEEYLEKYFEGSCLADCLTDVVVSAYELEKSKTFFFTTYAAKKNHVHNYYIRDIARATSAAPTYFTPATIVNKTTKDSLTLIDGGIAANNPALAATVHAIEMFGHDIEFFVVSLGTGTTNGAISSNPLKEEIETAGLIGWASRIVSTIMCAVSDTTNYEMYHALSHKKKQYYRFQPILEPQHAEMDNADSDNIEALRAYANRLINGMQKEIMEIVKTLNTPR